MSLNNRDTERYMHYFGRVPRTKAERKNMNAQIYTMESDEYEAEQARQEEEMNKMFMERFGRLPRNNAEEDAFLQQLRDDEDAESLAWERQLEQEDKLVQLHRYHPNSNTTMAEELQRFLGHPIPFNIYVSKQEKAGVSFEQAINQYAQGGPVVEGVGKGPNRQNAYANAPKVLKKANAQREGLIPNPHNGAPPYAPLFAYGGSRTRRRRHRGGRRRGRTSRK